MGKEVAAQKLKTELLNSMNSLLSGTTNSLLLSALRAAFPPFSGGMVLNWIPEQAEDIYCVLIDSTQIAIAEVPRLKGAGVDDVLIKTLSLSEFRKQRLSSESRRKLQVALEILEELSAKVSPRNTPPLA